MIFHRKYLSFDQKLPDIPEDIIKWLKTKQEKKKYSIETDPQLNQLLELWDMDFEITTINKFEKTNDKVENFSREIKSINQM